MAEGAWRGPAAPPLQGSMPSQRLRSEIHANPVPPPCVQNAMLTKDKKPFTYTPGGIDLSEIRSPRMAKRIERNAQAPGVGEQPKSPNTYHPSGPLPPSALAAMQTNMPVQVFPSGAPPPPPPPPPTQQQAPGRSIPPPPPPPPPQGPLPTKPVSTNEGVFDRPDMTRIIPDNPMAMLRKTPKIERMNFLDELNDLERQQNRPPPQQYQQSAPIKQNVVASPQYQNQAPQYAPLTLQLAPQTPQYSPPVQKYQVQSSPVVPYVNSGPSSSDQHRSEVGVLYIPPVTTSNGNNNPNEVASPPTPPIRNPQSPQSPQVQLNKAPRPWQNQKRDEEKPTWAHKAEIVSPPQDEYIAPPYQPPQQQPEPPRRQQSYQQPEYYPHPQMAMYPGQGDPNAILNEAPAPRAGVDVVWVTQPQVMVHPGVPQQQQQRSPQPQQQQQTWQQNPPKQQPVDGQGARIIPIQVEREQPPTPERNFNRQQSWGPPTQSNSFKVLQKITSTDGELDDDNSPATEHPPKTSQEFNQTPADQIRKMKMSQDDRELVHKFKQVPKGQQQSAPYVRNIPIQIEGDDSAGPYVHPSQQSVPEPKKYTGGNIPGRSFKMLQSMTGQTSPLATNSEYYETNQPYRPYNMLYPPPTPYLPYPPYDYWPNYYYPKQPDVNSDNKTTPEASRSTTPSVCSSCRNTPVPFWNYYYPMPYYPHPKTDEESNNLDYQQMCDPFYYPYYYYYLPVQMAHLANNYKRRSYTNSEELASHCDTQQAQKNIKRRSYAHAEDWSSSNDEIAYYNQEGNGVQREMLAGRVLKGTTAGVTSSNCEDDGKSFDKINEALEAEDEDSTDSEEDIAQCKVVRDQRSGGLQSIKSVKDMNALNNEESEDNISEVETLIDEEGDNYITTIATSKEYDVEYASTSLIEVEDTMPNILSVIFVESACSYRTSSVFTDVSDDTIVLEDRDSICEVVSAKLPLKLTFIVNCDNEDVTEIAVGNHEVEAVPLIPDIEATLTISEENSKIEECENSSDSSEIDFWSEIITEEEVVPKPNRLEVYKNALRDVDVVTNKTIEKTDEESTVCVNKHRNSSYDAVDLKENQNSSQAVHIGNSEIAIGSFEFNKKKSSKLHDDTKKLKKHDINKASRNCETFNKTSSVEKREDAIVVVGVEDYKLSNFVFERQEDREISTAPSLELDLSVEEFGSKRNGSKKGELEVEDKTNEENKATRVENTLKNYGDQDHVEINSDELKTNDTSDTVKSPCEETHRTSTVEDLQIDQAAVPCYTNSSNSSSLSRSSSTSGKEYVKDYSEGEESEGDESGPEDDHETPVVELDSQDEARTTPKNDRNNNEQVAFGVPSIKVRIQNLQEASCTPTIKIIATMEVAKGTNKLPNIVQVTENKSIDNSEDEGDSGVTSDMSRHISDSESEFSELRKMSRYQRAATHSRLYQLLHSSCSEEELRQEETKTCEENMMKRREHLTLPLKKSVDSESSSGLNSPSSPLTDKLAYELVLSLLRKKKGQIFRNMPMEKLHAAALKILQEDKDCTDLSSSEDFHNCLSPLRTDTQYSTPAQTPAEFYANSTYSDYYATWQNYDEEPHFVVPKKKVTPEPTPKCPRVPIVPKPVSKVPPDHVPS